MPGMRNIFHASNVCPDKLSWYRLSIVFSEASLAKVIQKIFLKGITT
jgi:hypothetical protein